MRNIAAEKIWPKVFPGYSRSLARWQAVLWLTGLTFILLAALGPQIGTKTQTVQRQGVDVIVALDVSLSMKATDIPPDRLAKAKYQIAQLIDLLEGDRIGLIVFAGLAHPQCPLTVDYAAANLFLQQAAPDLIPVQGTAIGDALRLAGKMFVDDQEKFKALILFSDGEDLETDPLAAAKELADQGVIIHAVGIGTPQGGPIPVGKNRFKKDRSGDVVVTRLMDQTLREIANIGNGIYINVDSGTAGLEEIYARIDEMQEKDLGVRQFSDYEDRFQGFLLVGLMFILAAEFIPRSTRVREN